MPFPSDCRTVGQRIEYVSRALLPARKFDEYVRSMGEVLHERVHYIDPVHELTHRDDVLAMLAKYVPRAANEGFEFALLIDGETDIVWRWTIRLKIRFTWFRFTIHGLVHAKAENGKIVYQREYYDPMESIGVVPIVGWLYKLILKMG